MKEGGVSSSYLAFFPSTFWGIIYLERLLLLLSPSIILPFHLDNIHYKSEKEMTVFCEIIIVMAQSLYIHQLSHKIFNKQNIKHQKEILGKDPWPRFSYWQHPSIAGRT
jgi:hypothetical protein